FAIGGGSLIAGFDPDGKSLIIHSALHSDVEAGVSPAKLSPAKLPPVELGMERPSRPTLQQDKGRLVRVDLQTGQELGVLAQDPQCDVADAGLGDEPSVIIDPTTHAIQA